MKQSIIGRLKMINIFACAGIILISSKGNAQMSTDQNFVFSNSQKVHVDLSVTPSSKEFKAGITNLDSAKKVRVWVCNGEEQSCSIKVMNAGIILWSSQFADAYYDQIFDLSQLQDGEYEVQIPNRKQSYDRKILVRTKMELVKDISLQ